MRADKQSPGRPSSRSPKRTPEQQPRRVSSAAAIKHKSKYLVGRIRLRLNQRAAGHTNGIASKTEVLAFLREQNATRAAMAELHEAFLFGECVIMSYSQLRVPDDARALLSDMEDRAWTGPRVLEVTDCPSPFPSVLGVAAATSELEAGGRIYVVTVVDDGYPDGFLRRFEVRASRAHPEPALTMQSAEGMTTLSLGEVESNEWPALALKFLVGLLVIALAGFILRVLNPLFYR